jgi:hypothetical protein
MSWTNFKLTSAEIAKGGGLRALNLFEAEFSRLGGPPDMAMFSTQPPGDDYGTYYLSPATQVRAPHLIRLLGAQSGDGPSQVATLVVGVTGSRPNSF